MNKKLIFVISGIVLLGASGLALAADPIITLPNPLCMGGAGSQGCINSFPTLIAAITTFVSTVIGILAVLMFVIAGIFFVTSAGSPEKIKKARDIAMWAAIGVAISLMGNGLVAVVTAVIGAAPAS